MSTGGSFVVWLFLVPIATAFLLTVKFKTMAMHTSKSLRKDNPRLRVTAQLNSCFS